MLNHFITTKSTFHHFHHSSQTHNNLWRTFLNYVWPYINQTSCTILLALCFRRHTRCFLLGSSKPSSCSMYISSLRSQCKNVILTSSCSLSKSSFVIIRPQIALIDVNYTIIENFSSKSIFFFWFAPFMTIRALYPGFGLLSSFLSSNTICFATPSSFW